MFCFVYLWAEAFYMRVEMQGISTTIMFFTYDWEWKSMNVKDSPDVITLVSHFYDAVCGT